jgi:hypothetical protein
VLIDRVVPPQRDAPWHPRHTRTSARRADPYPKIQILDVDEEALVESPQTFEHVVPGQVERTDDVIDASGFVVARGAATLR